MSGRAQRGALGHRWLRAGTCGSMVRVDAVGRLADVVAPGGVVLLTGAGISTDSGIPDYRGPTGIARRVTPMTYQLFTHDPVARRRYWARSQLGRQHIAAAVPNSGHTAVADLQSAGLLSGLVTQNVDGLHTRAGARDVVELHGRLDRVRCLACGALTGRDDLDVRLRAANPSWTARATAVNPDGDVELPDAQLEDFRVVDCADCHGMLKPDVVFFGETVPRQRVQHCFALVESARALVVLGSSLTVMSGYRFVLRAAKRGVVVAIVNQGSTRGDDKAVLTVDAPLGQVLPALVERLRPTAATA